MFFNQFIFRFFKLLVCGSIAIQSEETNCEEKSTYLHNFTSFELFQGIILIAIFMQISSNADTRNITSKTPTKSRPDFVSLGLHIPEVSFVIKVVNGYFIVTRLFCIFLLQIGIFLLP